MTSSNCQICTHSIKTGANFCPNCRYPVGVKKLNEFTQHELSLQLSFLHEVMSSNSNISFENKEIAELYEEIISCYWLRPESALMAFMEMRLLAGLKKKYLRYPLLDLGCGDGLFTSVLFGARLNEKYDAYEAIDFANPDPYDAISELPKDFLRVKSAKFGFGIDIKQSSVAKSSSLKTYEQVKLGDVRRLPFKDQMFNSVFSNMVDDLKKEDLEQSFKEVYRVLKKGGYFVFVTPNENFRKFLFYHNRADQAKKSGKTAQYQILSILDRGRSEWEPRPLGLWKDLFGRTSFKLVSRVDYADRQSLLFWDTGLRPFFKHLMDARKLLSKNNLSLEVKKIWVDIMKRYLYSFVENPACKKGAFSLIIVKK